MHRRDFLIAWIEALLFALFPALRGLGDAELRSIAQEVAVRSPHWRFYNTPIEFSIAIRGYELNDEQFVLLALPDPALHAAGYTLLLPHEGSP